MALVISNTNYKVNHLRALKGYRPWERADTVSAGLSVRNHKYQLLLVVVTVPFSSYPPLAT